MCHRKGAVKPSPPIADKLSGSAMLNAIRKCPPKDESYLTVEFEIFARK
jgi:hypothetical protein